jgi:hypothetical protein
MPSAPITAPFAGAQPAPAAPTAPPLSTGDLRVAPVTTGAAAAAPAALGEIPQHAGAAPPVCPPCDCQNE